MSVFSNFVLARDGIFDAKLPVWHETDQFPLTRFESIGVAELTELMTRYRFIKADSTATYMHEGETFTLALDNDSPIIAISRDIPGDHRHLKTHGGGYAIHDPQAWLTEVAMPIIDLAKYEGLRVESAINLEAGRYCAISLSSVDPKQSKSGLEVRKVTSLLTSLTGELPSKISTADVYVVCDNTAASSADGRGFEIKHTANSVERLPEFKAAFERLVSDARDDTLEAIDALAAIEVSEDRLMEVLNNFIGLMPVGSLLDSRSAKNLLTRRQTSLNKLMEMSATDPRCAPWKGTALGAYQTLSTYDHYCTQTRGSGKDVQLAIARFKATRTSKDSTHNRVMGTLAAVLNDERMTALVAA